MADVDERGTGNRALVYRIVEVLSAGDYEALRDLMHPDVVQEMPQSGERVRGIDNLIATFARRPEPRDPAAATPIQVVGVLGEEPRYVMTPTFNLVRVEGTGDQFTVVARSRYPDGSDWYVISLITLQNGKVVKQLAFFAPCYPAPEWRASVVEPMS